MEMHMYANDHDKSNIYEYPDVYEPKKSKYDQLTWTGNDNKQSVSTSEGGACDDIQLATNVSQEPLNLRDERVHNSSNPHSIRKRQAKITFLSVMLLVMFLVIAILQVLTIVHLNLFPVLCPISQETATSNAECIDELLAISDDQILYILNNTEFLKQLLQDNQNSMQRLTSIISTLSILGKNNAAINASIRNVTDHISLLLTHIDQLVNMTKDVLVFADGHVGHAENTTKTLEKLLTSTQLSAQNFVDIITTLSGIDNAMVATKFSIGNLTNQSIYTVNSLNDLLNVTKDSLSSSYEHIDISRNNSGLLQQMHELTQSFVQKLTNIVNTLTNIEKTDSATQGVANDTLAVVQDLLSIQNDSLIFSFQSPISCQDIKQKLPNSLSGYYHVNSELTLYCHMGELCSTEGAWTRLGHFDMTDSTVNCPSEFQLYTKGEVRACGRPNGGASCVSVKLPSNGISYSEVCGRVIGYQYASPDAADTRNRNSSVHNNINTFYVDGVSITHGYPRKHIWSLMAGVRESYPDDGNCPCNTPPGSTQNVQSFVGNDYFCESGNPNNGWTHTLYTDDPLWDGKGCGNHEANCCSATGLPWFHKTLNSTTNYIELRECNDEDASVDDAPISFYEIYVK